MTTAQLFSLTHLAARLRRTRAYYTSDVFVAERIAQIGVRTSELSSLGETEAERALTPPVIPQPETHSSIPPLRSQTFRAAFPEKGD